MKLLIDIGNSRIKWAFSSANTLSEKYSESHKGDADTICEQLFKKQDVIDVVLVHVLGKQFDSEIIKIAGLHSINLLIVHSQLQAYGIETTYLQPKKLGSDRFVAMLAAHHLYAKQNCIVIDCGTAVTIDTIDTTGRHLGGIILPGLHLCEDSLINKAKNLTQIKQEINESQLHLFANTTALGVKTGCHYSLAATIDRVCREMEQAIVNTHAVKRIICGGDAKTVYALLEKKYELNDNLLMQGLQFIAK